jgi:cation-transporting P-type ATPase C
MARAEVERQVHEHLRVNRSIDCICFDKTGTLTGNLPVVASVMPSSADVTPERILGMAAAAQQRNIRPVARSLLHSAPRQDWSAGNMTMIEIILDRGVKTRIGEDFFAVGNSALMEDEGIDIGALKASAAKLVKAGCSVIYVARNAQTLGVIGLKYDIKPNAAQLLAQLRQNGIAELHLLSGDNRSVVAQRQKN